MTLLLEPLLEPFAPLFELTRPVRAFVPAADVDVTDDDITVRMDLPGLSRDDVTIELQDDVLTVRGERALPYRSRAEDDGRHVRRIERGFGKFRRQLRLPAGVDPDAITASMTDGVLTLHIAMPQERKPRRIEIASGEAPETIEGTATEQRELAGVGS